MKIYFFFFFFFQAEDGIRDVAVTGVQTCALPIFRGTEVPVPGQRRAEVERGGQAGRAGQPGRDAAGRQHRYVEAVLEVEQVGGGDAVEEGAVGGAAAEEDVL